MLAPSVHLDYNQSCWCAGDPIDAEGLDAAGVICFANCVPSVASIRSAVLLYTVNSQNALANYL